MKDTLYYAPGACSLAVHVLLEWIGDPYDAVAVDQHAPSYRTINPAGAVPALTTGNGATITQAGAVLRYLATRSPGADLLDDGTPETAAELDRWSCFITGDLHPAFFPVFTPRRYTSDHDETALEAVRTAGLELVRAKLVLLNGQLEGRTWLVGGKRTYLDAYVLPMLDWAAAKMPDGLGAYPACKAHHDRLLTDPAVRRVKEKEAAGARPPAHTTTKDADDAGSDAARTEDRTAGGENSSR